MSDNQFEILSPAGSLETFKCAVNNGADAVYIGGKSFSARKNAVNFSDEEIVEAVKYAHLYGVKVYVTVNTVISDNELFMVYDFVKFLYESGVDALIIQDIGVLKMIRECFPDFEVHASTQMTIHNADGARLAKKLGFKRVVLSRELTFEEIKHISQNVDIELEVFVHGALCMSYSGQCLMSSFLGGRSGNRGACAQPCRLPYTLCNFDRKPISQREKYLLSLKDLCLIDEMATLKSCGVTSLKIEGRMKSAEYVSLVTSIYSKYKDGGKVSDKDYDALESIFSRSGFTKGYLEGNNGRHMLNYEKNNDNVYMDIKSDVLSFAESLCKKQPYKIPFDAKAIIALDKPMTLIVSSLGKTVTVQGEAKAQKALNVSLDFDRVKNQISKTGSTPFELKCFDAHIEDSISLPIKEINELRRLAINKLTSEIANPVRRNNILPLKPIYNEMRIYKQPMYVAQVYNIHQAKAALDAGYDTVLVSYGLYLDNTEFFKLHNNKIALLLPPVMRDSKTLDLSIIPKRVYATNLSHFETFSGRQITADFRINVFNSHSVEQLSNMGASAVTLSTELNIRQISKMSISLPAELVVYGRIPVMTVQNCLVKSALDKCMCTSDAYFLKDRKGIFFPLYTDKHTCTNVIYNSAPVYMADKINDLPSYVKNFRFIFTVESPHEVKEIYHKYKNKEISNDDFTRGHYYRGV